MSPRVRSRQPHNTRTRGEGEGGEAQPRKGTEPIPGGIRSRAGRNLRAPLSVSKQHPAHAGEETRCGFLGLASRQRQVCRIAHGQCGQRCAQKTTARGRRSARRFPAAVRGHAQTEGAHLPPPPRTAVSVAEGLPSTGVPFCVPNSAPPPSNPPCIFCNLEGRAHAREARAVAHPACVRRWVRKVRGPLARGWAATRAPTTFPGAIAARAVPTPSWRDTRLPRLSLPLPAPLLPAQKHAAVFLPPFIYIFSGKVIALALLQANTFGTLTFPNICRPVPLLYGQTRSWVNRYAEPQRTLHKERSFPELIAVRMTASFSEKAAHFDPSE